MRLFTARPVRPPENNAYPIMKRFNLTLVATFFAAIAVSAGPIVLSPERANHTATLMNTGAFLIAGGINENATLDSALLYDPNGQNPRKLKVTGTMTSVRSEHTATLLNDGKVLVAGGELSN